MVCFKKILCVCLICFWATACSLYRIPLIGSSGETVTVKKGMTLYAISRQTNVPVRTLIEANNLKPPYTLSIGQKIKVPKAQIHVVKKSETLYSISKRYGLTVSALSRQNNIQPPYTLSIGQKLIVSGGSYGASAGAGTQKSTQQVKKNVKKTPARSTKPVSVPKGKKFAWPVKGKIISDYGSHGAGQYNDGINIAGKIGSAIKAAESGTVVYANDELKGYGHLILIKHANGWITAYAHNDQLLVKKGQKVVKGQKIATMGKTGNVATPQLHFEIRYKTKVVNPKNYLQ